MNKAPVSKRSPLFGTYPGRINPRVRVRGKIDNTDIRSPKFIVTDESNGQTNLTLMLNTRLLITR